ncbi:hypothetical protein GGF44_000415 [Coemansia sp. RSA 1694]|nr:hypothetical protein GGF44_000415 [Coemansia sp. RSA 1694]
MYPVPNSSTPTITSSSSAAQMGPYNFQLPQHSDSHDDNSYLPPPLTERGLPSSSQVVRPFASSSTMASGRVAKAPHTSSSSGMVLPPLPPMSMVRGPSDYSATSQYHNHHTHHQVLPPLTSYHAPPPPLPLPLHHHHHHQQHGLPLPPHTPLHSAGRHTQQQYVGEQQYRVGQDMSASPSTPSFGKQSPPVATRKRSRHAWPADMTRQIINVLLDEFLNDPSFRTTIYRSREERDHRFTPSGRSILEEYNKVQNIRRRYFIPLSYLLQWDQLKQNSGARNRLRSNIEKKLAKPLERSRLQMIFLGALRTTLPLSKSGSAVTLVTNNAELSGAESEAEESTLAAADMSGAKPMFELDIFVTELKRRDPVLWAQGNAAFHSWVSRKCSVDYILNH